MLYVYQLVVSNPKEIQKQLTKTKQVSEVFISIVKLNMTNCSDSSIIHLCTYKGHCNFTEQDEKSTNIHT